MKLLAPILLAVLFASCASPTPFRTFEPSSERPPVAPVAEKVDTATQDTRREADALRDQVGALRRAATEATQSAQTARGEVDRLVEQKSATEDELLNLSSMFKDIEQRNMFLETETEKLETGHEKLNATIAKLEGTVRDLRVANTRKDEEVTELRHLLGKADTLNSNLNKERASLAKRAARGDTWRNIGIGVLGLLFLLALLWVAVRTGILTMVGR